MRGLEPAHSAAEARLADDTRRRHAAGRGSTPSPHSRRTCRTSHRSCDGVPARCLVAARLDALRGARLRVFGDLVDMFLSDLIAEFSVR